MLIQLKLLCHAIRARIEYFRKHPDDGYTTETVLTIAVMVTLALIVLGIIAMKVTQKAESINLDG